MLRSFDTVRETAPASTFIAGDDRCVALQGGGDGYARPWHWHDCLMLILPDVGALNLQHETRPAGAWLSEGQFAIVAAGMAHETTAARDASTHVVLYVREDGLLHLEGEMGSLTKISHLGGVAFYEASHDIRSLQAVCRAVVDGPGRRSVLTHVSTALLIRCLSVVLTENPLSTADRRGHAASLVGEIKAFLQQRPRDDMPLDALAERFGLSRRHLTRIFRERTGLSIGEYQSQMRLETARLLLIETDLPIGEVAFRVGFDDASAFSRALRRRDGRSPRDVRTSMARSAES